MASRSNATVAILGHRRCRRPPRDRDASGIPQQPIGWSHVTVVYPEEIVDLVMLRARLEARRSHLRRSRCASASSSPTRANRLGVCTTSIDDLVGMWGWLREFVLAPPFVPLDVLPHATHRASRRPPRSGKKALKAIGGDDPAIEFRVGELHLVAGTAPRWVERTPSCSPRAGPDP
jgi:hypothetical protein